MKPLVKKGQHFLPSFCLNCYQHSWKNCYGDNPCTPVRLLTRKFPLTKEANTARLILQRLNDKVPFEEQEKWKKPRKKNDCEKARKRAEEDGKYADFSSL